MLRRDFGKALLTSPSLVATGCGIFKRDESAVRVAVAGGITSMQYLPHLLADATGVYTRNQIKVVSESLAGGSRAMRALLGGTADVVAGYYDHPIRITARGHTIRSFVVLNQCPGNVLIVARHAASRLRNIGDLRGSLVGVSDIGSQSHWFINYLAYLHRVPLDSFKVVAVGTQSAAIAALQRGNIDLWAGFDPGATRVLTRDTETRTVGDARNSQGLRTLIASDTYPGAVFYSTPSWLAKHSETARQLARCIRSSLEWIQNHQPEEIVAKVPEKYRGDDRALYVQALRSCYPMFSPDGLMPEGGPEIVSKVLAVSVPEFQQAHFDLRQTWTNEFVNG